MRRIKKEFGYSKVTAKDLSRKVAERVVIDGVVMSGKVTQESVAKDYHKEHGYCPLEVKIEEVKETRVMSAEVFIKYSSLLDADGNVVVEEDDSEDDSDDSEE